MLLHYLLNNNNNFKHYLSYGLPPHICAALFTNHVTLSEKVYRNIVATNQEFTQLSPQQYAGIIVGNMKHNNGIKNL